MHDYQKRVIEEESELSKKVEALSTFLDDNSARRNIDPQELSLLEVQLPIMQIYLTTLRQQITLYKQ